ncbi:MAG TPA: PQQ-binding-like beta-propeller repeat protein, partial [Anaerolineales bacterium]|nr:PQQ-binding-like beta-propeller repeat protein [Anaerolineales bacterium]
MRTRRHVAILILVISAVVSIVRCTSTYTPGGTTGNLPTTHRSTSIEGGRKRTPNPAPPTTALTHNSSTAQSDGGNEVYLPFMSNVHENQVGNAASWPMAGANPQRTSWTPNAITGNLDIVWFKPIEPYILGRTQVIVAYDTLYISTARGLYAFTPDGEEKWIYPTELPLGHSPTIDNGVAYVGGFDKKIHAIDAYTGKGLWTFAAAKGFQTNPLVVNGVIYAGNRDGYMYAIGAQDEPRQGELIWKFKTEGPILFSAAYKNGTLYFASDDSRAYALRASDGTLLWKSAKLPGAGFQSFWPVVYMDAATGKDYIVIAGSHNYRRSVPPGPLQSGTGAETIELYPNRELDPKGTLAGPLGVEPYGWAAGTITFDASKPEVTSNGATNPIANYLETKPWRRTQFVIDAATGKEVTFDFDMDGKPDYAPISWVWTSEGTRYPPVVGYDGVLYQRNNYLSDPAIPAGGVTGWKFGSPYFSIVSPSWHPIDELGAYLAAGKYIYWAHFDSGGQWYDISLPNELFAENYNSGLRPPTGPDASRTGSIFKDFHPSYVPVYTYGEDRTTNVYGRHSWSPNPPIPYKDKVYILRGNSLIAAGKPTGPIQELPLAKTVKVTDNIPVPSKAQVQADLEIQIQKMVSAGHLRPGYVSSGLLDFRLSNYCGDDLQDYWHWPGDTIYTLLRALPHLSPALQGQVKSYLQKEFNQYPPYSLNHIGWAEGAGRENFDLPPEVKSDLANFGPKSATSNPDAGWSINPYAFYATWLYAKEFAGAKQIFDTAVSNAGLMSSLTTPPSDSFLIERPFVLNAYLAGLYGYLELEKLAGYPETTKLRNEFDRLFDLRVTKFTEYSPFDWNKGLERYCNALAVSRNFIWLVPEIAQMLHDNPTALAQYKDALPAYSEMAEYWFVSKAETELGEGITRNLYDYVALFQGKALILKEPYEELAK